MDRSDLALLSDLMDLMRKKGAQVVKLGGVEVLLGPDPGSASVATMRDVQARVARAQGLDGVPLGAGSQVIDDMRAGALREPTDEEILFGSSRGFPTDEELSKPPEGNA